MSVPTLGIIKLSVLSFYRRIFVIEKRNARNGHNLLACIISLWIGGFTLTFMFACKGHFSAWWTSAFSLMTKCIDTLELLFAFAVTDFVLDAAVILLPIPVVCCAPIYSIVASVLTLHILDLEASPTHRSEARCTLHLPPWDSVRKIFQFQGKEVKV
jgi:hypothetical protein